MGQYKVCVMAKGGAQTFSQKNSYSEFVTEYQTNVIPRIGESIDIEVELLNENNNITYGYKRFLIMNVIHFYSKTNNKAGATLQVVPI